MRRIVFLLLGVALVLAVPVRHRRSEDDAPLAKGLRGHEIRRKPPMILEALGPIAFGERKGDDIKMPVQGLGTFGAGNVKSTVAKFIPDGMGDQVPNGGTFALSDRPNLGYMDRETTAGKTSGSRTKMNFAGIGQLEMNDEKEQGTGLLDFSKNLFPFLQLPELKSDGSPDYSHTAVDPSLADFYYPKERSNTGSPTPMLISQPIPNKPSFTPYKIIKPLEPLAAASSDVTEVAANPFDSIKSRPGYPGRSRVHAAKTQQETEDADLLPSKEGFIPQGREEEQEEEEVVVAARETGNPKLEPFGEKSGLTTEQKVSHVTGRVPLAQLGLNPKEAYAICAKFAPVAAKYCYGPKVEEQYVAKCQGYNSDCQQFQGQAKPLGAIANAFKSGVGLTYYDWGVNGIPYYPVNEEGGIGNGHHGKVDFGSYGGGYSDNLGVRDFWSQTGEYGANWYEGTYGYKTGWSIPLVQSLGVEGGAGTQVHVPIKEGELGKPLSVTNGYHVGPYLGLADKVGVDWYNGGVSVNQGFAVPFIGVGVNTGTAIGFPSVGHIMNRMGVNGIDYLNQMAYAAKTFDAVDRASEHTSRVDLKEGRGGFH